MAPWASRTARFHTSSSPSRRPRGKPAASAHGPADALAALGDRLARHSTKLPTSVGRQKTQSSRLSPKETELIHPLHTAYPCAPMAWSLSAPNRLEPHELTAQVGDASPEPWRTHMTVQPHHRSDLPTCPTARRDAFTCSVLDPQASLAARTAAVAGYVIARCSGSCAACECRRVHLRRRRRRSPASTP